jgi:ElaB/YqjD/DUF883 family membrane-anchored ribosome-binding protein
MNMKAEPSNGLQAARRLERRVQHGVREANRRLVTADRNLKRFVRAQPLAAAFCALAAGFILGRLVSRS